MKYLVAASTVVVMVLVLGVAKGMPLDPEPRQFVYQPGSPSVRLYPVHFEHYLKSSLGRVQLSREDPLLMQGFRPNMLLPEIGKTERPSDTTKPMMAMMTPEMEMKPMTTTTTTTTTSMVTTSEPKTMPVTIGPMLVMEDITTLQPETMMRSEEDSALQPHTDVPSLTIEDAEPVTESVMAHEGDLSHLPDGDEVVSVTEAMLMMEDKEPESATEFNNENETTHEGAAVADNVTVTELVPENEVATEFPNTPEEEVF